MNLTQVISILKARSRMALTIFALVIGATLLASILLPKRYVASTEVVIDLKPDPVNGGLPLGLMIRPYLKTQADIVSSERLRLMVVDRFDLANNPDYTGGMPAGSSQGVARQYAADHLARNLTVSPGSESTMLTISYRATDPQVAADLANAFARAYIDTNIEMRTKPATQRRDWFVQQAESLRNELDNAQKRLVEFQRKNNIVTTDESRDVSTRRLETLSASLTEADAQAADLAQRVQQAQQALEANTAETIPEVIASPAIQALKAEQSRLRAAYGQQLAVYGRKHPTMKALGSELWTVGQRINNEVRTIIAGLEKSRDSALARVDRLRSELDSHQTSVLAAKNYREDLLLLERDVENARRAYDQVKGQLSQTNLESASTYANLFVLSPAIAPGKPSSPRLLLNLLVAIVAGTILAIGISLLAEMRRRRVHSQQDMEQATGRPMLGRISNQGTVNPMPQG